MASLNPEPLTGTNIIPPSPYADPETERTREPYVHHRFELAPAALARVRATPHEFGFDGFGEAVYFRSYSRRMPDGRQERWPDTVLRVVDGVFSVRKDFYVKRGLAWDEGRWQEQAERTAFDFLRMRALPPGRGLFMMGTDYVYRRGSTTLFNCMAATILDLAHDLGWVMDMLCCGVGVGVEVTPDLVQLYLPSGTPRLYVVPDSREGWVESLVLLLRSYQEGSARVDFDYSLIRPKGACLKGLGGVASGPEPLVRLHEFAREACERYLRGEYGATRLKADLANMVGCCVVSGGVRHSAMLILGKLSDPEFLSLKDYDAHPERAEWGWSSNNSVALETNEDFLRMPEIAAGIRKNGEPGFVNRVAMRKFARFGREVPDKATLVNPCTTGETLVMTTEGSFPIANLVGTPVDVWNGEEWSRVEPGVTGHDQPIVHVTMSDGSFLRCTPEHRWVVERQGDRVRLPAHQLVVGDQLVRVDLPDGKKQDRKVLSVRPDGHADTVFCFTEKRNHMGTFNGIVTGQCGEVALEQYESCNVSDFFPPRCKSDEELTEAVRSATLYTSTVALLPTHRPETNRVVARNRRIGVSVSGVTEWLKSVGMATVTRLLRDNYKVVVEENRALAEEAGVPESVRKTCVKPGGTVPQLVGTTSGASFPWAEYTIRRMRVGTHLPIVDVLREAGYHVHPDPAARDTAVVEFPVRQPDARRAADVTVWEQALLLVALQREWSDNAVSVTLTYSKEEARDLENVLASIAPMVKSVSALPRDEKTYPMMPIEEVTRDEYESRRAELRPVDWSTYRGDGQDEKYCQGDKCDLPPANGVK